MSRERKERSAIRGSLVPLGPKDPRTPMSILFFLYLSFLFMYATIDGAAIGFNTSSGEYRDHLKIKVGPYETQRGESSF